MTRAAVAQSAVQWLRAAARIGHVATGTVYVLVGVLAVAAAVDRRRRPPGPADALHELGATAVGAIATVVVAVGLIADALWQAIRAWRDFDRVGTGISGLVQRASVAISGLLHLGLSVTAATMVLGYDTPERLEPQTKSWLTIILSLRGGKWLVAMLAAITFMVAVTTMYRAVAPRILARLNLKHLHGVLRSVASISGRLGLLARGILYAMIAVFLGAAAYHQRAADVKTVGGALRSLQYDRGGRWLLAAIALGFIANGAVELIRARHRTIRT